MKFPTIRGNARQAGCLDPCIALQHLASPLLWKEYTSPLPATRSASFESGRRVVRVVQWRECLATTWLINSIHLVIEMFSIRHSESTLQSMRSEIHYILPNCLTEETVHPSPTHSLSPRSLDRNQGAALHRLSRSSLGLFIIKSPSCPISIEEVREEERVRRDMSLF